MDYTLLNKQHEQKKKDVAEVVVQAADFVVVHQIDRSGNERVEHKACAEKHIRGLVHSLVREKRGHRERDDRHVQRNGHPVTAALIRKEHRRYVCGHKVPCAMARRRRAVEYEQRQHGHRVEVHCAGERGGVSLRLLCVVDGSDQQRGEDGHVRRTQAGLDSCVVFVRDVFWGVRHRLAGQRRVSQTQALVVHRHVED